jgi:hypothetical protein
MKPVAELSKLGEMYAGLTRNAYKPVEQAAAKAGSPNRLRSANQDGCERRNQFPDGSSQLPLGTFLNKSSPRNQRYLHLVPLERGCSFARLIRAASSP